MCKLRTGKRQGRIQGGETKSETDLWWTTQRVILCVLRSSLSKGRERLLFLSLLRHHPLQKGLWASPATQGQSYLPCAFHCWPCFFLTCYISSSFQVRIVFSCTSLATQGSCPVNSHWLVKETFRLWVHLKVKIALIWNFFFFFLDPGI